MVKGFKKIILLFGFIILFVIVFILNFRDKDNDDYVLEKSDFWISSNSLEDFDLYFLKLENNSKNMVYSPLSIKYTLEMLSYGSWW